MSDDNRRGDRHSGRERGGEHGEWRGQGQGGRGQNQRGGRREPHRSQRFDSYDQSIRGNRDMLRQELRERALRSRERMERDAREMREMRRQSRRAPEGEVKKERNFLMIIPILAVVSALIGCWFGSYYIIKTASWHFGWHPAQLTRELITYSLGIFLWGCSISIMSQFAQRNQNDYVQQLIDALKRISRGDFQVYIRLPGKGPFKNPFHELVMSINETAVNLKNMEDLRQEFISNVSHEIQSPLTSIGGFARVLKSEELGREQTLHYLDIIEKESARLSKLSENMLRLASLESDHPPFYPEAYRLDKQLQMLILACEPQWHDKQIDMNAELAPVTIDADPDLLSQVWVNILHNAIKFTSPSGEIKVELTSTGDQVHVSIKDTGIGIAEEDLPHIFERFYKADRARSRKDGGNGLGLSIIKKIVEIHHGEIDVESKPGEGTQFTVILPLKPNNGA